MKIVKNYKMLLESAWSSAEVLKRLAINGGVPERHVNEFLKHFVKSIARDGGIHNARKLANRSAMTFRKGRFRIPSNFGATAELVASYLDTGLASGGNLVKPGNYWVGVSEGARAGLLMRPQGLYKVIEFALNYARP